MIFETQVKDYCACLQLCSSNNELVSSSQAFMLKPMMRTQLARKETGRNITYQVTSIPVDRVPDMGKRKLMNLLLLGAISLPTAGILVPYASFFVPLGWVLVFLSYTMDRELAEFLTRKLNCENCIIWNFVFIMDLRIEIAINLSFFISLIQIWEQLVMSSISSSSNNLIICYVWSI